MKKKANAAIPDEMDDRIERWMRLNRMNRSEAIRDLLRRGMKDAGIWGDEHPQAA